MILLDTHVWIWWVNGLHDSLPPAHLKLLAETPSLGISAISCLEMVS